MIKRFCSGLYADDEMVEGSVRILGQSRDIAAAPATARFLLREGIWGALLDFIEGWEVGTYAIPSKFLDEHAIPDEVADLVASLQLAERWVFTESCSHGPCILPADATATVHGFRLCLHHGQSLAGWEHLVA